MGIESLPEALPEGVDDEAYVLATSYVCAPARYNVYKRLCNLLIPTSGEVYINFNPFNYFNYFNSYCGLVKKEKGNSVSHSRRERKFCVSFHCSRWKSDWFCTSPDPQRGYGFIRHTLIHLLHKAPMHEAIKKMKREKELWIDLLFFI